MAGLQKTFGTSLTILPRSFQTNFQILTTAIVYAFNWNSKFVHGEAGKREGGKRRIDNIFVLVGTVAEDSNAHIFLFCSLDNNKNLRMAQFVALIPNTELIF